MMNRKQRIISLLTHEFNPNLLELRDDSARHAGHAGASPEGENGLHALAIKAMQPDEKG